MESTSQHGSEDLEKRAGEATQTETKCGETTKLSWWKRLASYGVETRGVEPVALEDRTDRRPFNIFSFWWTASLTLLAITNGIVGTLFEGLSLESACLTILFFTLLAAIPPAALGILGPQTGMRQIVQARYSFGLYTILIVALFNLATTIGWSIVAAIIAGQTLSAVSGGSLSWDLGIVVICILSLVIAFLGYKVVHTYERYAWIPALIAIVITVGCGGSKLKMQAPTEPVTGPAVLTYGCVVTSFTMTWAVMASDFSVYIHPSVPKTRIFLYTYLGLVLPTIPLMCLGAAIGGAVPSIPSWAETFEQGSTGGVMFAMLSPAGGFGKFVAVVLAFSLLGNIAGTMYSISVQFQMLVPVLSRVPRYVFSVLTTAIIIAVAIPISQSLETSLENFLGIISYWSAVFIGVISTEYLYFRKGDPSSFDHAIWNVGSKLPLGVAAISSIFLPVALIVPCMSETWYTGPIARTTGDIGFEVGFVLSVLCYIPLRTLEIRLTGR
ncbi:purine-cytosine permease FCY21 [Thozetella sp. PMI_491]|nr:purine-cytosine permease FCY21 [Thozetella sp. PMI_491]